MMLTYDFIAGAVGGMSGLIVGHPFDTLKIKMQIRHHNSKLSIKNAFEHIHRHGWMKGHFRGLSAPLFSYVGLNAIYFGVYGNVLRIMMRNEPASNEPSYINIYIAASVAGVVQVYVGCPFEVAKVVLQSQISTQDARFKKMNKGPVEVSLQLLKNWGIRGVYQGATITLLRDFPSNGMYMMSYEYMTHNAKKAYAGMSEYLINFVSGGLAGVLSWIIILPLDVVKNRFQADHNHILYRSIWHCVMETYRQGGISSFYRGATIMSIRAFLVNSLTLMIYSHCIRSLKPVN